MVENMNGLSLDFIIHPGETVKEALEENNMSQEELAIRTGFSAKHVSEVVNGKKGISAQFAKGLEYAFDVPMEFWINLQGLYDKEILEFKAQEEIREEELAIVKKTKKITEYAAELGILEKNKNAIQRVIDLRKLCGINNLDDIKWLPATQVSFRIAKTIDVDILYLWLRINEVLAKKVELKNEYNQEKLEKNLDRIKKTMFLEINKAIEELTKIFAECGIIFQVSKFFRGAPVQGFIKKIKNNIMLTMTIRGAFADIFWFTLFHEIGHLINRDFNNQLIDYELINSEKEIAADEFASNCLISKEKFDTFMNLHKFTKESIKSFAKENDVQPFIVVGRLEKELNDYSIMANMRLKYEWED